MEVYNTETTGSLLNTTVTVYVDDMSLLKLIGGIIIAGIWLIILNKAI
jgi:hypothetical protein